MKLKEMKIKELFDTSHTIAERIFDNHTYPGQNNKASDSVFELLYHFQVCIALLEIH